MKEASGLSTRWRSIPLIALAIGFLVLVVVAVRIESTSDVWGGILLWPAWLLSWVMRLGWNTRESPIELIAVSVLVWAILLFGIVRLVVRLRK